MTTLAEIMRGESNIGLGGLLAEKFENRRGIFGSLTGNDNAGNISVVDAILHRPKPVLTALGQRLSTPANVPLGTQYPIETALNKRFGTGTQAGEVSYDSQEFPTFSRASNEYPNQRVLGDV